MDVNHVYLLMIIISFVAVAGYDAQALDFVNADEIVAQIQIGTPVNYDHAIIHGYLYLKPPESPNYDDTSKSEEAVIKQSKYAGIPVRSTIKITNSIIDGNVNFDHADFQDSVSFEGTNFTRGVSLREAVFRKNAIFTETKHGGYVNFWLAKFNKDANFENVLFKGYSDFRDVQFNESAIFLGDQFYNDAKFYKAKFLGHADFSEARFHRDASFGNVIFNEIADFDYSCFNGYSDFRFSDFIKDAEFIGSQFNGSADFRDSKLNGDSDFRKTSYATDFDIRGMKFSTLNVDWSPIANYLIADGPVYLQLIKNFKNLEQFGYANDCYYKYRISSMNEKSMSDEEKYLDALSYLLCGFGVRPDFPIIWMVTIIVLFVVLYWNIDIFKEQTYPFARNPSSNLQNTTIIDATMNIFVEQPYQATMNPHPKPRSTTIIDALIFSSALFFTLPPPLEYIKSRRFRILYVLERMIGWLIMGLFLVTLLNAMIKS